MKAEHRKELETNVLADTMGQVLTGAKQGPSRSFLFFLIIGFVGVVGLFLIYRWMVSGTGRTGVQWAALEDGSPQRINDAIESGVNTNPAKAARLQVAYEALWYRGIKQLGGNANEAWASIDTAEQDYVKLAEDTKGDPVYHPEALYALAVIEETRAIKNRENLASAMDKYKAVIKSNKDSAFAKLAEQRIEDLENKNLDIERFYQHLGDRIGQMSLPRMPGLGKNIMQK